MEEKIYRIIFMCLSYCEWIKQIKKEDYDDCIKWLNSQRKPSD